MATLRTGGRPIPLWASHFSSATPRTPCRRSRPGEPTPPSRARTTWPGSSPRSWAERPGRALLSTYHDERHPVGRFNARQSLTGPSLAGSRLDDDRPQLPADEEAPMFASADRLPVPLGGRRIRRAVPTDPDAVQLVEELRGQPGTRVPHVWVRDGVSTLDLLGPGFTVLTGDERWCAAAASASVAAHRICSDEWAAVTGTCARRRAARPPDDFVGWRADELPADPEAAYAKHFRRSSAASASRADAESHRGSLPHAILRLLAGIS